MATATGEWDARELRLPLYGDGLAVVTEHYTPLDPRAVRVWEQATPVAREGMVRDGWNRAIALDPDRAAVLADVQSALLVPFLRRTQRTSITWALVFTIYILALTLAKGSDGLLAVLPPMIWSAVAINHSFRRSRSLVHALRENQRTAATAGAARSAAERARG